MPILLLVAAVIGQAIDDIHENRINLQMHKWNCSKEPLFDRTYKGFFLKKTNLWNLDVVDGKKETEIKMFCPFRRPGNQPYLLYS